MAITYTDEIDVIECSATNCGVRFGLTPAFRNARKRDHETFYCPNGHPRWYPGKSDLERAREERDRAQEAAADTRRALAAERKQHAATKGKVTRLTKRAAAGMCAQCGRTFQNYARHMASKHSEAQ